jgi:hypothetical protein
MLTSAQNPYTSSQSLPKSVPLTPQTSDDVNNAHGSYCWCQVKSSKNGRENDPPLFAQKRHWVSQVNYLSH